MFKKIFAFFKRNKDEENNKITEEMRDAYNNLYVLQKKHHFAWVQFYGDKKWYQSALIELNLKGKNILMDEPFGLPRDFIWVPGTPMSVTIKEFPHRLKFDTQLARYEMDSEQNRMVIEWPNFVDKQQRRADFRLNFLNHPDFEPCLVLPDYPKDWFPLRDLSASGLGFETDESWLDRLFLHSKIVGAQLHLSSEDVVLVSFEIRRIDWDEETGKVSIGVRLYNRSVNVQRALDQFVLFVQRKENRDRDVA